MDKPLPDWVASSINRPSWQLLVVQWLILAIIMLLASLLLVCDEWQQLRHVKTQQQLLERQNMEYQQRLDQLPALETLKQRLQARRLAPYVEQQVVGGWLSQVGGQLLLWQQHDLPSRQTIKLQTDYQGILRLVVGIPFTLRIDHMIVEKQPESVVGTLTLLAADESRNE